MFSYSVNGMLNVMSRFFLRMQVACAESCVDNSLLLLEEQAVRGDRGKESSFSEHRSMCCVCACHSTIQLQIQLSPN